MHVLLTRPEADASQMKDELEALGHQVSLEPLLRIERLPIEARAFDGAQAVIATSRNGLRSLGASPALAAALKLPILTVGPGTAALARELKFERVIIGSSGARGLVPLIAAQADADKGPLVHVAGDNLAFDLAAALAKSGLTLRTLTCYRAVAAAALSPATAQGINEGALDAVILMSPRSAEIFVQLVADAGLGARARSLVFFCLSPTVADALGTLAPPRTEVADAPNSEAILAAVARVATEGRGV